MRMLLQVISTLAIMGYPLAVYFGLQYLPNGVIALLLCGLLITRLTLNKQQVKSMLLPLLVGIGLTGASFVAKQHDWLLFYPVVINISMLGLFAHSLIYGPSMIERLAKLKQPDLPAEATPYLIKVTQLWCVLFIFNGTIALYTALETSIETWTLYNGLIAYLLIGCLLGGEWLYRTLWLKKHE
ncbi:COG4648 family protein [Shewanella gaetbuli]